MNQVDEMQFGRLLEKVAVLETQVLEQGRDIKLLLSMADRGRGAIWMAMSMSAMAGAVASWILSHWVPR